MYAERTTDRTHRSSDRDDDPPSGPRGRARERASDDETILLDLLDDGIADDPDACSAWDPDPVLPAHLRATAARVASDRREAGRMQNGFYLAQKPSDAANGADASGRPHVDGGDDVGAQDHATKAADGDPDLTHDQRRSRRRRGPRAKTISLRRVTKHELAMARDEVPEARERRLPMLRSECADAVRPCPFVSCAWHLFLDVDAENGSIKLNFPDLLDASSGEIRFGEMRETCALDVADRGGATLEVVGSLLNLTRERARQIEGKMLAKLQPEARMRGLDGHDHGEDGQARPALADA